MIDKSKEWPENLGVGKPYDVDTRIQDYLNVYCLEKMNKAGETAGLKKSIVDYTNNHKYPSFSNILAVETLKAQGEKAAAEDMVQKMEDSDNPVQKWVVATAKRMIRLQSASLEKEFAANTNFLVIKKCLRLQENSTFNIILSCQIAVKILSIFYQIFMKSLFLKASNICTIGPPRQMLAIIAAGNFTAPRKQRCCERGEEPYDHFSSSDLKKKINKYTVHSNDYEKCVP